LTFPHYQHLPSRPPQLNEGLKIASVVPRPLLTPEFGIRNRINSPVGAAVKVPKASMHIDNLPQARQYDIGNAWEVAAVNPKPEPQSMDQPANQQFGFRVPRFDCSHDF
jgi:hypothetical protein